MTNVFFRIPSPKIFEKVRTIKRLGVGLVDHYGVDNELIKSVREQVIEALKGEKFELIASNLTKEKE